MSVAVSRTHAGDMCRIAVGAVGLWISVAADAYAVIPGLAPGLAAVLPQLFLLLLTTLGLLFSPRTWWRWAIAGVRHPLRTCSVGLTVALLLVGVRQWRNWLPPPEAAAEITDRVAGFSVGDVYAARGHAHGLGPISAPRPSVSRWTEGDAGTESTHELTSFGDRVLVLWGGRQRLVCFDPVEGKADWAVPLDDPVVAGPLGFERRLETGERSQGVAVVTARPPDHNQAAPSDGGEIIVLDGADGSIAGRLRLPAAPDAASALVDERLLVALEESIICVSLASPSRPVALWRMPRPALRSIGMAGDRSGRFFLLDSERLVVGDLDGAGLRELKRFGPDTPRRLAVYRDRAYVLSRSEETARLTCFDPALSIHQGVPDGAFASGCAVWSRAIERPVDDDLAVGSAGVVVRLPGALEIRELERGSLVRRLTFDTPTAATVAVASSACYVALANAELLRYSPALDRVVWRISLRHSNSLRKGRYEPPALATEMPAGAGEPAAWAANSLVSTAPPPLVCGGVVVAGDRLVVELGGAPHVIAESPMGAADPWGQWRGGPRRTGTSDGQLAPLAASILWRRQLQTPLPDGGGAAARDKSQSSTDGSGDASLAPLEHSATLVPMADGWLLAWSFDAQTLLEWMDDYGVLRAQVALDDGACAGMVRIENQLYAVLRQSNGRNQAICLAAEQSEGEPASLRVLWRTTIGTLTENEPIAATNGRLVVSLASSLRVMSSEDGSLQWESVAVGGAAAPLVANRRIYVAGREPDTQRSILVALDLGDGQILWRRHLNGDCGAPLSLSEDRLFAALRMPDGEGRVQCLSAEHGALQWEYSLGDQHAIGGLVVGEQQIVFRGSSDTIFVLSTSGQLVSRRGFRTSQPPGQVAESLSRQRPAPPAPVIAFGMMILPDGRTLRCLDSTTFDSVWEHELSAPVSTCALARGRVVVCSGAETVCLGVE